MPYARSIQRVIGLVLVGALATGCAPEQKSGSKQAPPAASTATQLEGSAASTKDAANTTQLEKAE